MANFSIFLLVKENVLKEGVTILGKGGKKEYVINSMRKVVYAMKTKLVYTLYPRIAAKCYYDVDDYANRNAMYLLVCSLLTAVLMGSVRKSQEDGVQMFDTWWR